MDTQRIQLFFFRVRKVLSYVSRGDFKGLKARLQALRSERAVYERTGEILPGTILKWCVMATPHTLFIGNLVAKRLRQHGWHVTVTTSVPERFDAHFYVVVCPQMFSTLPPPERRFVFQLEQSVSSRWFTQSYFKMLEHSRGVFDYALVNLEFLEKHQIVFPLVNYLPIGSDPDYAANMEPEDKIYDVLFYGDAASSPRRLKMLETLKRHFEVRHCSEVFGDAMNKEIRRAKVVINIHYYPSALLEMPRIQECLALGVPVVSEASQDQHDYPEVHQAVRFFDENDEAGMIAAVRDALENPISPEVVADAARLGWERFCFMFDRFLVGAKLLPHGRLAEGPLPLPADARRVTLSLPETITRRRSYDANRPANSVTFDGARYTPGWIGCGLSYGALAHHALRHRLPRFTVLEDDAQLPDTFEADMATVEAYLDTREGEWDVFAGLIADVHADVRVLHVEDFEGMRFVTVDKMTSTVCNIYSPRALKMLADWTPVDSDVHSNTIDRYLGSRDALRVVVALPFLVSLREELNSTLWGIGNSRYLDMIKISQRTLQEKAAAFLADTQSREGNAALTREA